ncbi:MAG: hypothetical protein KA998_03440 [Rickettsiaceae bacterium]|nr:hypothetical protein [Rickettsiaceae bacterium]
MPQLDIAYFPSQFFWLFVSFCLLYIFLKYRSLPKIENLIGKRVHSIKADIDNAAKLRDQAIELKGECEAHIHDMHEEVSKIKAEILNQISIEKEDKIKELNKKFLSKEKKVLKEITEAKELAVKDLRNYVISHSALVLEKVLGIEADIEKLARFYGDIYGNR